MPGSARFGSAIDELQGSESHSFRGPLDDITIREIATARSIGREPSAGQTFAVVGAMTPVLAHDQRRFVVSSPVDERCRRTKTGKNMVRPL
jgi:hypothetical protein